MPAKLGPRVTDRSEQERRDASYAARVSVMILCARHGTLRELEDAAQPHVIACLILGAKLKP